MSSSREISHIVNSDYEFHRAQDKCRESAEGLSSSAKECVNTTVVFISLSIAAVSIAAAINPIAGGVVAGIIVLAFVGWIIYRACKK